MTVERGATVVRAELADTIVGHDADLEDCRLQDSLVGARARVQGVVGSLRLADDSFVGGGG